MVQAVTASRMGTTTARAAVRRLMPVEADLAFRRRCETVVEFLDAGPDARILDCGCGYGFLLRILADITGAEIVGLDSDASRLEHVRRNLPGVERLSLVAGDARTLPFGEADFSHAVCSEVLEHLDDDRAAVAELFRVLRPGGVVVVTVPSAKYPFGWDPLNYVIERLTGRHLGGERTWSGIWYGHKRLYLPGQLRLLLEEAGFIVEAERPLTHYCPPFAHLTIYGILKPLLLRGLLPKQLAHAGDRHRASTASPSGPVGKAMRLLERIDRPNDDLDLGSRKRSFVALSVKARKPQ